MEKEIDGIGLVRNVVVTEIEKDLIEIKKVIKTQIEKVIETGIEKTQLKPDIMAAKNASRSVGSCKRSCTEKATELNELLTSLIDSTPTPDEVSKVRKVGCSGG